MNLTRSEGLTIGKLAPQDLATLKELLEGVIGEDEDVTKWTERIDRQVAQECNQLRAEQRERLAVLFEEKP